MKCPLQQYFFDFCFANKEAGVYSVDEVPEKDWKKVMGLISKQNPPFPVTKDTLLYLIISSRSFFGDIKGGLFTVDGFNIGFGALSIPYKDCTGIFPLLKDEKVNKIWVRIKDSDGFTIHCDQGRYLLFSRILKDICNGTLQMTKSDLITINTDKNKQLGNKNIYLEFHEKEKLKQYLKEQYQVCIEFGQKMLEEFSEKTEQITNPDELSKLYKETGSVNTVGIDQVHKIIRISTMKGLRKVYLKYSDIKSYEILDGTNVIQKGGFFGAAVGAAVGGSTGAVIGSQLGKTGQEYSFSIRLKLYTNRSDFLQHEFVLSTDKVKIGGMMYNISMDEAKKIAQIFQIAINYNESKNTSYKETVASLSANTPSITDELIKAKELMDAGLLTQEEFEKIKAKLL